MLANVRKKNPPKRIFFFATAREMGADNLTSFLAILFDKHDVPPRRRAEVTGVVVRIS
jgi:hypothetical protein